MCEQLSPALRIGLDLAFQFPELAGRIGNAIRLVEAGNVCRQDGRYYVYGLVYYPRYQIIPGWRGAFALPGAWVTASSHGYWCECEDFLNGIVGWAPPYSRRVALIPGFVHPVCCHVLAVHFARIIEVEA